ncbi:hypothetical protein FMO003_35550 [Moritella sp. F3]|nr:hypothetical protein FMO001_20790 [Moritella sp. F1]GIC83275.1 hypothetical protein FMO003_35550 [Moritella sp. F3]
MIEDLDLDLTVDNSVNNDDQKNSQSVKILMITLKTSLITRAYIFLLLDLKLSSAFRICGKES